MSRDSRHQRRTIELPRGKDALTIAVVADTHGRPNALGMKHLAALQPDRIVHAGDIGDLEVLDRLGEIAPVLAVRGNIDAHARDLPDTMTIEVACPGGATLRVLVGHIVLYGPKIRAEVARLAKREGASLVLCGHSHVPFLGKDKGLVVFNPGSIGPKRFQLPILFGVLSVGPDGVEMHHVAAETGERWEP